jgi:predicted enzyme related to lactoylglutathione lyase
MLLKQIESVVLFVQDIDAAAIWYAELFQTEVQYENHHYAFIRTPGCLIGFHPQDSKCPGGVGGATVYWEVADLQEAIRELEQRGAVLYRGPIVTSLGAVAAMLLDPFGCTIGLNQSHPHSEQASRHCQASASSRSRCLANEPSSQCRAMHRFEAFHETSGYQDQMSEFRCC